MWEVRSSQISLLRRSLSRKMNFTHSEYFSQLETLRQELPCLDLTGLAVLLLGPLIELLGSLLLLLLSPTSPSSSRGLRYHKWRTTFLARINAGITGLWAVWALYDSENIRNDLLNASSRSGSLCLLFSLGVHAVETVEMVLYQQYSLLTVHHIAAIASNFGVLQTQIGMGFGLWILVPEINAVFNKTRILHLIGEVDKLSTSYRINSYINVFTFFLRVVIVAWLHSVSYQLFVSEPNALFTTCVISLTFFNLWNMSCFKTIVQKDILGKAKLH